MGEVSPPLVFISNLSGDNFRKSVFPAQCARATIPREKSGGQVYLAGEVWGIGSTPPTWGCSGDLSESACLVFHRNTKMPGLNLPLPTQQTLGFVHQTVFKGTAVGIEG